MSLRPIIAVLLLLILLISGCASDPYDRAYMAAGEGLEEQDLSADSQFTTTEDFNLVIKLNKHGEPVTLTAQFIDPNGDLLEVVSAEAPSDVGTVVLGIDYEARGDQVNEWIRGRYHVDVQVDGEQIETLYFRVD